MIADVLFANLITLFAAWGFLQFHRHDYRAPWLAYAALLIPAGILIYAGAQGSPYFDAIIALR